MNQAIRSVPTHSQTLFLYAPTQLVRGPILRQVSTVSEQQEFDKAKNPKDKTGDLMSRSFGEGYSTRSDEEGFGGTCGGNDPSQKIQIDKEIHENHPAYDKTQGSEVKEKEKGRHQKNAAS